MGWLQHNNNKSSAHCLITRSQSTITCTFPVLNNWYMEKNNDIFPLTWHTDLLIFNYTSHLYPYVNGISGTAFLNVYFWSSFNFACILAILTDKKVRKVWVSHTSQTPFFSQLKILSSGYNFVISNCNK